MAGVPPIAVTLIFALFFVVGFGILGSGIRSYLQSRQARAWPKTEGTIESCGIVETKGSDGDSMYQAAVVYSYTVADKCHQGDCIAFGYAAYNSREPHQEIVDKLSSARTVLVRYDPANPSRAVLSYGLNRSTIQALVFGATWLLFVTGCAALVFSDFLGDSGILKTLVTTR